MKCLNLSRALAWTTTQLALGMALVLGSGQGSLAADATGGEARVADDDSHAADLVSRALEAEVAGDADARDERLYQARREAAAFGPARWHSGMIESDGQWTTLATAELKAKRDPLLQAYDKVRAKSDGSERSLTSLARWCQRQGLAEQARAHWFHVLMVNSTNQDALGALELRWHAGALLTLAEIEELEHRINQIEQDRGVWEAKAQRWRQALASGDADQRHMAEQDLERVSDPAAIPALVDVFSETAKDDDATVRLQVALMTVLARMDDPVALEILVTQAVDSPSDKVREAAVYGLKSKPWHAYVPGLLWKLQMPLELGTDVENDLTGTLNSYSLYREGPAGYDSEQTYYSRRETEGPRFLYDDIYKTVRIREGYTHTTPAMPAWSCNTLHPAQPEKKQWVPPKDVQRYSHTVGAEDPTYRRRRDYTNRQSQGDAVVAKSYVEQLNRSAERYNRRVADVLAETTGAELGAFPRDWWAWWQTHLSEHPDVRQATLERSGAMAAFWTDRDPSAFARGTLVWTRTGQRQIQDITPGDDVLSQNPVSGELAYKAVLMAMPAEAQQMRRLGSDADALVTTAPGNFIWATGQGWRMARDLDTGTLVHGIAGSRPLAENAEGARHEAVRLVVADFHTYYVGAEGMLVHDATLPRAAGRPLPGLEPVEVAAETPDAVTENEVAQK